MEHQKKSISQVQTRVQEIMTFFENKHRQWTIIEELLLDEIMKLREANRSLSTQLKAAHDYRRQLERQLRDLAKIEIASPDQRIQHQSEDQEDQSEGEKNLKSS